MFVIEILRYGRADLGQHLFGAYNDLDLNKEMPFEHKSYIIGLEEQ